MKWLASGLTSVLLVAVIASASMAASPAASPKTVSFTLTGRVQEANDTSLVVRIVRAPKAIVRYAQKGILTVTLAPKAVIRMGKKSIAAGMLKPNEVVSVAGWYKPSAHPTFHALRITAQ